ncbi:hypothetical protein CVV38_02550 [Candidatus Peregrinibacteria bacterium HGW-Peregrinibacteria-1]|jgi:hypothetical protein|nr:MAG: hypothetical protein CVV38_02550 [Candidatus Peregrinibacteria bacterium HGW-Peregrinibacteria-1]
MKKLLLLSILAFSIVFAAGCAPQATEQPSSTEETSTTEEEVQVEEQTDDQAESDDAEVISYTNANYGFTLELPQSWAGYQASEVANDGTICFSLPSAGGQPFCIFQLYVVSLDTNLSSSLKLVGETSTWKIATDNSTSCEQFNDLQCDRTADIAAILASFEVIN